MKILNYDVAIIGCGISGIFAGYELTKLNPQLKVLMIEQGNTIVLDVKTVTSCVDLEAQVLFPMANLTLQQHLAVG
jgi:2-polyprenyl-6-methoxyphenol hydroxylase-like FAD-dependent oxidoreductase